MEVIKLLTNYNHNEGTIDRITHLVIHYTGSVGSAKSQCVYFQQGDRGASAHYFVDHDGSVWQSVEDKDIAWHCGGKTRYCDATNANSIGIEMCCKNNTADKSATSKGWYFEDATVVATIELAKELIKKYNIPLSNVVRHYDCTHKICPNPFYYNNGKYTWNDFKNALGEKKDGWVKENGWKYYKDEKAINGFATIDHYTYYFDEDGTMLTGWQFVENGWYYFEEEDYSNEGAMWVSEPSGKQHRLYT